MWKKILLKNLDELEGFKIVVIINYKIFRFIIFLFLKIFILILVLLIFFLFILVFVINILVFLV